MAADAVAAGAQTSGHNPYTVPGVQVRTALTIPIPGMTGVNAPMRAAIFQEIAPCKLVSMTAGAIFLALEVIWFRFCACTSHPRRSFSPSCLQWIQHNSAALCIATSL